MTPAGLEYSPFPPGFMAPSDSSGAILSREAFDALIELDAEQFQELLTELLVARQNAPKAP